MNSPSHMGPREGQQNWGFGEWDLIPREYPLTYIASTLLHEASFSPDFPQADIMVKLESWDWKRCGPHSEWCGSR